MELIATFARMTGRPITPATVATHAELAPLEGSTAQDLACLQVPEPGALLCTQVTLVKGGDYLRSEANKLLATWATENLLQTLN